MTTSKEDATTAEAEAFLTPSPPLPPHEDAVWTRTNESRKATQYLRLVLELTMAAMIGVLLANLVHERNGGKRSPVPTFPRKVYTFLPDPQYVRDDMLFDEHDTLHTLHNWIPLSAQARGYIHLPTYSSYPLLSTPFSISITPNTTGPAYMMSVFHQLHCLSYLAARYQQGYAGTRLTAEVAHHSAHCLDYLRQSVMCAGDTNLEGEGEGEGAGPGWGSRHECVDYDAVLAWANEHSTMSWRSGLMPGEAVL